MYVYMYIEFITRHMSQAIRLRGASHSILYQPKCVYLHLLAELP